ncbi:Hypothetical predicted protein, partial [Mytilus galloprovincialis]
LNGFTLVIFWSPLYLVVRWKVVHLIGIHTSSSSSVGRSDWGRSMKSLEYLIYDQTINLQLYCSIITLDNKLIYADLKKDNSTCNRGKLDEFRGRKIEIHVDSASHHGSCNTWGYQDGIRIVLEFDKTIYCLFLNNYTLNRESKKLFNKDRVAPTWNLNALNALCTSIYTPMCDAGIRHYEKKLACFVHHILAFCYLILPSTLRCYCFFNSSNRVRGGGCPDYVSCLIDRHMVKQGEIQFTFVKCFKVVPNTFTKINLSYLPVVLVYVRTINVWLLLNGQENIEHVVVGVNLRSTYKPT